MPSLEPQHIANLKKPFQDFPKGGRVKKDCSEALAELAKQLDNKKEQLKNTNRTARLWVQFLEYVDLMKQFIRAERLGGWEMHCTATKRYTQCSKKMDIIQYVAAIGNGRNFGQTLSKNKL